MITLDQAAASLIAAPRPILFLDTCTLLDLVRAPLRDLTAAVRAGIELRALAASGTVRLFVQDIVPGEWADNLPAARRATVAVVTLSDPATRNAIDDDDVAAIGTAASMAADDPSVGAVVLTGAGGAFCSGGSIFPSMTRRMI